MTVLRRLLAHPFHPPTTHFPIGLLSTSLLWDVISLFDHSPPWKAMAYWSLAAGLAFAGLALTVGMVDAMRYVWVERAPPPTVGRLTLVHLSTMCVGLAVFGLGFYLRHPLGDPAIPAGTGAVALSVVGTIALLAGGWVGGELVYGQGVGTRRRGLP